LRSAVLKNMRFEPAPPFSFFRRFSRRSSGS
jgi:hypothetical protein